MERHGSVSACRKDISPRELTVLSELCISRDQIAERMNRPVFKVISDALLLDIARNLPEKDVDLAGLGLSPKQIHLWGDEILEAVKRGTVAPLVEREQAKRPNDAMLKRLEKLKNWRKKVAEELKSRVRYCPAKNLFEQAGRTSTQESPGVGDDHAGIANAVQQIWRADLSPARRLGCGSIFTARRIR